MILDCQDMWFYGLRDKAQNERGNKLQRGAKLRTPLWFEWSVLGELKTVSDFHHFRL